MRGVFILAKRKIGAWTIQNYPELAELFYDPAKKALGVGDGSVNGTTMLTEDKPQTVTNKVIDAMQNTVLNIPAVGCLVVTATDFQPDPTFMACDGSAVLRTAYPELFKRLGIAHGQGDGVSTFNLPLPTVMGALDPHCKVWIKVRP